MTRHLRAAALLLCLALAAPGCKGGAGQAAAKKAKEGQGPTAVQVLELKPSAITRSLRYDADVQGELEVNVLPLVTERIMAIKVEEGDRVSKGQVLAVVRADALDDSLRSARAAISAARAERDSLGRELARQNKLLQREVVSQAQVDQLGSRLKAAEAQIARLQAMASQASSQRQQALVKAPVAGVVGRRYLEQGDLASPSRPLFSIVQLDRVELRIEVSERDLADIRAGMRAEVEVARYPGRAFVGVVRRLSPTIDRRTRTARVEVTLDNAGNELMPGMLARVRLQAERREGVVVVPYASLLATMSASGETEHRAFVVAAGKAVERRVQVGIMDGDRVEIRAGLKPGEQLVTRGQHLLEPGMAVKIVERLGADGKVVKVAEESRAGAGAGGGEGTGTGKGEGEGKGR